MLPAVAQADPWQITYEPPAPVAGEVVTFHAERENGLGDPDSLVWDFGDSSATATGQTVTHTYAAAGHYTVTLSSPVGDGTFTPEDTLELDVGPAPPPPNTPPSAAFTFTPSAPVVGQSVLFSGGSDPDGDPLAYLWNFGDLSPVSSEPSPSHSYALAGSYTATLSVTDGHGPPVSTFQTVTVSPRPQSPTGPSEPTSPPGGGGPPATPIPPNEPKAPTMMRPFPVVRIAGVVLPHGALVRILSVRAPRGARIEVRCSRRGCPTSKLARTSATRLVRLHPFERRLRAGVRLELFVRKAGRIGKYTRFVIRAGKPPARVDRCLMPGRARPVRCP